MRHVLERCITDQKSFENVVKVLFNLGIGVTEVNVSKEVYERLHDSEVKEKRKLKYTGFRLEVCGKEISINTDYRRAE